MAITKIDTPFRLDAPFRPTGDQPGAIAELTEGLFRGDRYQTLLGATGTGKSIGHDDPVFVVEDADGERVPRVCAIGPWMDALLEDDAAEVARWGDTEELDVRGRGLHTQAFDPETGEVRLFPVHTLIRHDAPAAMYGLRTACGRRATLTGDHNLWVLRDGRLTLIETADARATDYLPVPEQLESGGRRTDLDLTDQLGDTSLFVHAQDQVLSFVGDRGPGAFTGPFAALSGGNPYTKLHDMRSPEPRHGGVAAPVFRGVLAATGGLGGRWRPARAQVGANVRLPATLALTPSLLRLLGLYIAEGHATASYVVLASRDEEVRRDVEATVDTLGLPVRVRSSSDFQIGGRVFAELARSAGGSGSAQKHLPDFWPSLSDTDLGTLLRGYFDGDGTVERAGAVSATTASEQLASDLAYALLRFGIWARLRRRFKRATSSNHAGGWYWQVTVSGQEDLRRFAEHIGFGLTRKREALNAHLGRKSNTNVDVVPICGADLRTLRQTLGVPTRVLGGWAGVSRSAVQHWETEQRRPCRTVLRCALDALRREAVQRNVAASWWERWQRLRALCDVRWTPVEAVEPVSYPHPHVYDLSVPGPETFLAGHGGLFVHNTFSLSNVVQNTGKPTLVFSHNKTLAAQLYAEFKAFFPNNAVEFFISYYDYYQPEAYIVSNDTYIEKDFAINEEIDRLRLRATSALVSGRKDVIIVASVSCIYGLGDPKEYKAQVVQVQPGTVVDRDDLLRQLVNVFYNRNDVEFEPGAFRVRGDVVEVFPAYLEDVAYRIAFWGDEVETVASFDPLTGQETSKEDLLTIYPAKHFVTPKDQLDRAIASIEEELRWRLAVLRNEGLMLEAQRLEQRTIFDIEMIKEIGYCSGIENYSRHMDGREPGSRPHCLLDYFQQSYGNDWMLAIDESHVTIPQVRGMYNGDRARKLNLVEHGFRLPSALDNRPLTFEEFEAFHNHVVFVSATPADYELEQSEGIVVEQVIRPTGILDPEVEVRPVDGQIDDLLDETRTRVERNERVLVTTLTKRMSEDLTDYLDSFGVRVRYLHSDIDALARVDILRDLRLGEFDVLVGVNLLREGLDLPEVSLVAILDADKEGFLRSERSLIQTAGRAARNANASVIMYANKVTDSMQRMMDETERRRALQVAYNEEHDIVPQTVSKSTDQIRKGTAIADHKAAQDEKREVHYYAGPDQLPRVADPVVKYLTDDQKRDLVAQLTREMETAAENLEFEKAAELRDSIAQIEAELAA